MTDFEPATDLPELVDADDTPVASTAASRDSSVQKRRRRFLEVAIVVVMIGLLVAQVGVWWRVVTGAMMMYFILRVGFAMIGSFARPVPEPPPPGELRKVKLTYRCPECGAELRMTLANDEVPQAPRHCAGEMDLVGTRETGR